MSHTPPRVDGHWPSPPSAVPSPVDGVPGAGPAGRERARSRGAVLAAAGGLAALALVLVVVAAASGGGGGDGGGDGGGLGGAVPSATSGGSASSAPSNVGTVATTAATPTAESDDEPEAAPAGVGLPAVTIPVESAPPTTIPGSEPNSVPVDIFSGEEAPQFGTLVVDLDPNGYQDFAVHLRADQEIQLLSLADDGIGTEIEVYAPDGSREGWWSGGEPGVINGLEWYLPDEPLPATGTYVIRVIHTSGSHEPFVLGFFGNA